MENLKKNDLCIEHSERIVVIIRKIIASILGILIGSTMFLGTCLAAGSVNTVSVSEAKKAIVFQIVMDMKTDEQSPWHNKKVKFDEPIEVYDTTGNLYSYLFNLTVDGQPAGFIEASALKDDCPIISFSYEESDMTSSKINSLKNENNGNSNTIVNEKIIALAPGNFGLKQDFDDGSAIIANTFETIKLTKDQNKPNLKNKIEVNSDIRKLREDIDIAVGDIGSSSDGVTDNLREFETGTKTYGLVGTCPDLNQTYSSLWTGPSGCSPTSAANIMLYWADNGYPELTEGLSDDELLLELREAMGTYYQDGKGLTIPSHIAPGMSTFAQNMGISEASGIRLIDSFGAYMGGIACGPNVITFEAQEYYGYHSVTGVGWVKYWYNGSSTGHQYMKVHDNRSNTVKSVYVAYDRDYDEIYFDQFYPEW